jgi:hypothetical protein
MAVIWAVVKLDAAVVNARRLVAMASILLLAMAEKVE